MYEMNGKKEQKKGALLAKDCAYIAVFVALTIAAQLCLSVFPGVELVTVLFVTFSFAFGAKRGVIAATAFSLLRQLVFGIYSTVLILYLVYFNLLTWLFGFLGKRVKANAKNLVWLTVVACGCTLLFGVIDGILTPLWYEYTAKAAKMYFYATFTVTIPQMVCTAVTVGTLFLPLVKIFKKL